MYLWMVLTLILSLLILVYPRVLHVQLFYFCIEMILTKNAIIQSSPFSKSLKKLKAFVNINRNNVESQQIILYLRCYFWFILKIFILFRLRILSPLIELQFNLGDVLVSVNCQLRKLHTKSLIEKVPIRKFQDRFKLKKCFLSEQISKLFFTLCF